ncbi:condensin complex subunit 3 [Aplysia californica]|uniref:Condensin complex subunit 3 n=1 Tax=Aplysia californica TaxID=6500 RepID=A0ABM0JCF1_APLCA|nr:condensin complex subunit 3 [Aplysia californica]
MTVEALRDIFIECQDSQNQHQLVKAFKKLYNEVPFDTFWPEFLYLVKHPLTVYDRQPAVEKTIEFLSKAVTELAIAHANTTGQSAKKKKDDKEAQKEDDASDEEEGDMHPLLMNFFEFLLDVHCAKDKGIRFRVCQLVTRLLQNLGEGAKIDDSLYVRIYRCMVERLRDKFPLVRVHAVLALTRLQDPSDENCPITKAYIILMTRDPNVEVRRIILTCIAPSTFSLPAIIGRTRDVKDTVRRTAYTVIAEKIPLRALRIEQRIRLLQDGLNDRSEMVKAACSNKMLQAWLCASEGNVLDLLTRLDVQSSSKTCESALKILFKNSSVFKVIELFTIIDEKALVPEEKLTCESAFYWRNVVQYVQQAGNEYDEQLDKVRPNCLDFCDYLEGVTKQLMNCTDLDKMLDIEFMIQQLLQILLCMDLSDQASRKRAEKLLRNLLLSDHVGSSLVDHILPCLGQLHTDTEELVNVVAEIISEIREPITSVEKEISKADRRDLDKKIAGIRVKLNQLREELGECIEKQDFERAAQLKTDISNLDAERSSLLEETEPKLEEVRTQRDDPLTMLKCITVVCELLTSPKIKTLTSTLQMLMEAQVLPGMTNEEAEVRNAAVKAIGLCCLIKKDVIMQHLPLLLQATQMDTHLVRTTAMQCIFDIVHVHGLDTFSDEGNASSQETNKSCAESEADHTNVTDASELADSTVGSVNETADETKDATAASEKTGWSETASKIIAILSAYLDNESSEIRNVAAKGLAKLLLSGRVISPKLVSHLLLLWYNPMVEEDETLLQCLGIFFPLFAFSSSTNQEVIEEAFLPTLKTLLKAPSTSPLAEINEGNVSNFLVELTNAQHLAINQQSQVELTDNPCHDSLAVKLCNEVLSKPDSFNVKLWLKVLNQLFLSTDNIILLKDLCTMCEDMAIVITEKQCVKLLEKFREKVNDLYDFLKEKNTQPTSETGNVGSNEESSPTAEGDDIVQNMSGLKINEETSGNPEVANDVTPVVAPSARKTRGKSLKTPMLTKSTQGSRLKSALKSASKKLDSSALDDSVFATPAPLKGSRLASDVEEARVNLENLLVESNSKTPGRPGKTPKTPKRPLHSIQDPAFTG